VAVLVAPVGGDPAPHGPQDPAGQVGNPRPGNDEKAAVVGDPTQALLPLAGATPDPLVAHRALPGGGAKDQSRQQSTATIPHHVLEVLPHGRAVAEVVVLRQRRPHLGPAGRLATHFRDPQGPQIGQGPGDRRRFPGPLRWGRQTT